MLAPKISELKNMLLAEASLVEKMVSLAFDGLDKGRSNALEGVLTFEKRVNQLELEVEEYCISLIALYQPEAKDLRLILMIYKINNDLERLGDQAVNIAESAQRLSGSPIANALPNIFAMKDATIDMLKRSITAFTNEDSEAARQVCNDDSIIDDYNREINQSLIQMLKESPILAEEYLHLLRISKNLERTADLSTNIAENTIYLTLGKVIKHHAEDE
ncbi:MAG: phosphate signaling complex protein PhoU [Candidatus Cloacimonetes bacterium]|nr:phosphate signaling complex protein PhoU [Candidatus Cloacimonadota bacterium]